MKKVLVISPHPDDAELAMGGSIAKMVSNGFDVLIVDLTNGEPTPNGTVEKRLTEAADASNILKVNRVCLGMPNRTLEVTIENRYKLASQIRRFRPDVLFMPALPDYHPDHIAAHHLANNARFDAKLIKTDLSGQPYWVDLIFGYYSPHRHEAIIPSFVVDITKNWQIKLNAILAYKSQISHQSPLHKTSLQQRIKITNRYFGELINTKYAEPFFAYQPISLDKDLFFEI